MHRIHRHRGVGWPWLLALPALGLFAFRSSGEANPAAERPAALQEPAELQPHLDSWIAELYPSSPEQYEEDPSDKTSRQLAYGAKVFRQYCAGCHGAEGDGRGEAAPMLVPRPRNFRYGVDAESPPIFKFRSTASGEPPLLADVERTVRNGLTGSSMPEHRLHDPEDVRAVARYVLWIARTSEVRIAIGLAYDEEEPDLEDEDERTEFYEDYVLEEAERISERYDAPTLLVVGPETPAGPASLERGEAVYTEQGCHECHGKTGRGDGSSSASLVDNWGFPVDPRDFSTGRFRAGNSGQALYLRIRGGVSGTPMPAYEDLPNDDVWDLVHFIQSFSAGGER